MFLTSGTTNGHASSVGSLHFPRYHSSPVLRQCQAVSGCEGRGFGDSLPGLETIIGTTVWGALL